MLKGQVIEETWQDGPVQLPSLVAKYKSYSLCLMFGGEGRAIVVSIAVLAP